MRSLDEKINVNIFKQTNHLFEVKDTNIDLYRAQILRTTHPIWSMIFYQVWGKISNEIEETFTNNSKNLFSS